MRQFFSGLWLALSLMVVLGMPGNATAQPVFTYIAPGDPNAPITSPFSDPAVLPQFMSVGRADSTGPIDIFVAGENAGDWTLKILKPDAMGLYSTHIAEFDLGTGKTVRCMDVGSVKTAGKDDWLVGYDEGGSANLMILFEEDGYDPATAMDVPAGSEGSALNDCRLSDVSGNGIADVVWDKHDAPHKFYAGSYNTVLDHLDLWGESGPTSLHIPVKFAIGKLDTLSVDPENEIIAFPGATVGGWLAFAFDASDEIYLWRQAPYAGDETVAGFLANTSNGWFDVNQFLYEPTGESVVRWQADTGGNYARNIVVSFPFRTIDAAPIDWNNDTHVDALRVGENSSLEFVDLQTGSVSTFGPSIFPNARQVKVLDYTQDGFPDAVVLDSNGDFHFYEQDVPVAGCVSDSDCAAGEFCTAGSCEALHGLGDYEALIALPDSPSDLYTADVTNNGHLDLIVSFANSSRSLQVFEGDGEGGLNDFPERPDAAVHAITVGDVTGDGEPNIVVGALGANPKVQVFRRDGADPLDLLVEFDLPGTGEVYDIAMADIDNDGDLDLFVAQGSGGVYLFENVGNSSSPFDQAGRLVSGMPVFDEPKIGLGDVDEDGMIDLVVGSTGMTQAYVYSDYDPGTRSFGLETSFVASEVTDLKLAHHSSTSNQLAIYYSSDLASGIVAFDPGMTETALSIVTGSIPAKASTLAIGDVYGNGRFEAVYANGFNPPDVSDFINTPESLGFPGNEIREMHFADMTGNGFQDLVAATDGTLGIYRNRNSGLHEGSTFFGVNINSYRSVRAGDFVGDGLVDVGATCLTVGTACNTWFRFYGMSLAQGSPESSTETPGLAIADLNANNRLDLLFLGGNGHPAQLYKATGPGTFDPPEEVLADLEASKNSQVELAHVNDDGLLDIFVLSEGAIHFFLNDGVGINGAADSVILNSSDDEVMSFALGDVNADGSIEVVASYEHIPTGDIFVETYEWGGADYTQFGQTNLTSVHGIDKVLTAMKLSDVAGNGVLDIIAVTNGGGKYALEGDGSGGFPNVRGTLPSSAEETEESVALEVGDVNGDGHVDFVVGSVSGPGFSALRLYLGQPGFDFKLAWTSREVSDFNQAWSMALADVDRDGDLDLYVGSEMGAYVFLNSRFENQHTSGSFLANRPNNPTTVKVERPLLPFSPHATTAQRVRSGDVTIPVVLTDPESDDAAIRLEYSINGQNWTDAVVSAPSSLTLSSSPEGTRHALTWDADGIAGSEVRVRATIVRQNPTRVAEPIRFQQIADVSAPFAIVDPCDGVVCGGECVEGACFDSCAATAECAGADVCYLPSGSCNDPLDACMGITCAAGEDCHQGSCYPSCTDDGDCTPPFVCFEDRCQIEACDDVNCPEGDTCVGGSCFAQCATDADCPAVNEECVTNGIANFCQLAADPCDGIACSGNETCIGGGCFPQCITALDCVGDTACFPMPADAAASGCAEQSGACDGIICASGEVCVEGGCFQSCDDSTDCDEPDHVCYDATFCADATDPCTDVECPASYACYGGACYPSCVDDDDCSPPNVCFESACINGEDPCENVACAEGDVCYQGSCYPECGSNADCDPPFSVCFDSTFCQDTFNPCEGVVCAIGESCHEALCFPSCGTDASCGGGQACYGDHCTTAGDPCDGVVCPEGESCWEGGCFQGCAAAADCSVPTQCYQNDSDPSATTERCVPEACEGITCLAGEVCYGGGCFVSCTDDAECDPMFEKCFDAMRCATNPCQDVECPIGQFCHGGSCFLGCGLNQDCPGYAGFEGFVDVALATNINTPNHKTAGLTMGDINRDGALDGVINTGSSLRTRLYLSDGNFPDPIFLQNTSSNAPALLSHTRDRSVVLGDFTHNGYLDVARNTSGAISVHENAGASPWFPDALTTHYTNSSPVSTYSYNTEGMGWIDFDGDGDLDLIAQNQYNSMVVLENNPVGVLTQLSSAQVSAMGLDGGSANGDFLAMGDIQPNGNVDILLRMPGTSVPDLFLNNGDGTFTQSSAFNQNANDRGPAVFCDLDNDGDLDIIWASSPLGIWENTGASFVATSEPELSAGISVTDRVNDIACGDFNNNGMLDIYLGMHRAEDILFENRTTSSGWDFVQRSWGVDADGDSKSLHVADYNRSGSVDILVNHDDGNYLWRNNKVGNNYLMIQPLIDIGSGQTREAIGATVVVRDADGVILGTRSAGNARGRGGQEALAVHYGLPYGPKVPYWLTVIYPGGDMTEVCVVPELLSGYQIVDILDTDSDDVTACTLASDWTADIEMAGSGDFCFDGRCAETSCSGVQCGSEEVCYGGNCREECSSLGLCPVGSVCQDGACVDPIDPECDGGDFVCQVGFECVAGECMPLCSDDTDCGASEYCYLGVCTVDDCGSVSCGTGDVCYRGVCFEDCSSDGMCGEADESCFEGRCASDGCAALTDDYDSNFIYRDLDRRLVADQVSRPFFWPRPVRGASGTSAVDWLGFTGTSVTGESAPPPRTARVYMYFDETAPDGSNSEGRYALWLATGPDGPACSGLAAPACTADSRCEWDTVGLSCDRIEAGPTATYRIHIKDPGDDPEILLNDDNEGVRIFQPYDSPDEYLIQTQITNDSDTGGILIGYLDGSASQDWVVRIEAAFGGGIDTWEFYSPDGYHVPIDPRQRLTIRSRSFIDYRFTPDAGIPCEDDPVNPRPEGICGLGTSYCEAGVMRCEYTVQPWQFEVCDGLDNNCDGDVDEIANMRVPEVEWRQWGSSYSKWVTIDTDTSAPSILNFTPAAGDDRVGSVDILDHDGNSIQDADRQVVAMHRNLRTGELSMAIASGKYEVGDSVNSYSDRDVEMRVRFHSSSDSIDEMMVSWWDDRNTEQPAGLRPVGWGGDDVDDEIPEWETVSRFDLEWELQRSGSGTTATVEADAALLKAMWSGQSADFSEQVSRLRWTDSPLPQWRLYVAQQPVTSLNRLLSLRTRITPVPLGDSICDAGGGGACKYGHYQCVAGELSCGPPSAAACNTCVDADGDGYAGYDPVTCVTGRDCDDSDPDINPGVQEVCNGIDNDCDGIADVKDDDAYQALWGEPRPASAETCPTGTSCGPAECDFAFACVCPDGPEDPTDPPSEPCVCGSGLDDGPAMSLDPSDASGASLSDDAPETHPLEDPDAACSAAGGDLPPIAIVLVAGLFGIRVRRKLSV